MPICRTCRGEYDHRSCLCPSCGQPLGRSSNICHHCNENLDGKRLCPRCRSDVMAWERENFSLVQFIQRWGALGLLPSLLDIGIWALYWRLRPNSLYHPMMTVLSVSMSQVLLILLYVKRLFWRERWWASQIYHSKGSPLTLTIALGFIGGGVLGLTSFILYKAWPEPQSWQKLVFAAAYAPMYVLFTLAFTLLAIQDFMDRLDQRVPQPIFVHTHRLLNVVVDMAIKNLHVLNGASVHDPQGRANRRYEVIKVMRLLESGGIRVFIREYKLAERPDKEGNALTQLWSENLWHIEADRWGHVQLLQPTNMAAISEDVGYDLNPTLGAES